MNNSYPALNINLKNLRYNVEQVVRACSTFGIEVAGIVKGVHGIWECTEQFVRGGCREIGSSRMEQLKLLKKKGISCPLMLVRIPMLCEAEEVVLTADISLNSEIETLRELNKFASMHHKIHKVVLMKDMGDLREGFWHEEDLQEAAAQVEKMDNLYLYGIGTNLGCYGSILATAEKLKEFVQVAERLEDKIGRKLDVISGGATSSFMRVIDGDIPERVNHLRIGEQILLARDLDVFYGYDMRKFHQNVYTLQAQVVEVKDKPTYPVGEFAVDAFGHRPHYEDRGVRKRAIAAFGKVDVGSFDDVFPLREGIKILGGSSDHAILDVEDAGAVNIGDVLEFAVDYGSLVYLTSSDNVNITLTNI